MIHRNRMTSFWLRWLSLVLVLLALPAPAAVIAPRNLYEGEVLIDPQNPSAREVLMRQALGQVLVRITGDREITKRKVGIELLKLAPRLVQQYDYDRRPAPPVKGAPSTASTPSAMPAPEIKVFRARFDARVLDAQLRERGLPVWGRERPVTQVWLGVQEEGSRWLLTESIAAVDAPSLLQAALGRGVPLALPLAASASELQDVMQGATGNLVASARSSGHKRLLIGRITQKGAQWNGSWTLLDSNGQAQDKWQGTAANREEAFAFGIDQMANAYAARYAVRGGVVTASGAVRLQVSGVESAADYARVSKYLAGLSIVTGVELVEMADGRASYDLRLRGDRVNMQQAIALSSLLKPESEPAPPAADAPLSYQLVK
ncbi:MAG: DUF2066 domain-containing protein [Nevskiales bacterium]